MGTILVASGFVLIFPILSKREAQKVSVFCWISSLTTIILIHGQLIWAQSQLKGGAGFRHLYQYITLMGFNRAKFPILAFSIALCIGGLGSKVLVTRRSGAVYTKMSLPNLASRESVLPYLIGFVSIATLVRLAGGLQTLISKPGVIVSSQALLMTIGRTPIILDILPRLVMKRPMRLLSILYICMYLPILLLNSRILFVFEAMSFFLVITWRRPSGMRLAKGFGVLGTLAVLVFFTYGSYRERASTPTSGVTVGRLGSAIDWFYGKNVESGIGLAAVFSRTPVEPDFGASLVRDSIVQILPGPLRAVMDVSASQSTSRSVVPSSLEDSFRAFWMLGPPILGLLVGMTASAIDHLGSVLSTRAIAAALAPIALLLVRGSLVDVFVFGGAQSFLIVLGKVRFRN
jgi:hypothetical protein